MVTYVSKIGDGVTSPAVVIRTKSTTVATERLDEWAALDEGATTEVASEDGTATHTTGPRPAGLVPYLPDDETVDLLVHGLGKDYREFAVPYDATGERAGSWHFQ